MKIQFQKGDRVICIDDSQRYPEYPVCGLKKNKVYTVDSIRDPAPGVFLKEIKPPGGYAYSDDRFKLVKYKHFQPMEFCLKEIEISYSRRKSEPVNISSSWDVAEILRKIWDKKLIGIQEQYYALFCDNGRNIIGFRLISTGSLTGVVVDISLICSIALISRSNIVYVAHNHPSNTKLPSNADIEMTRKIKAALTLLNIELSDHIILTENGYYSFFDNGII